MPTPFLVLWYSFCALLNYNIAEFTLRPSHLLNFSIMPHCSKTCSFIMCLNMWQGKPFRKTCYFQNEFCYFCLNFSSRRKNHYYFAGSCPQWLLLVFSKLMSYCGHRSSGVVNSQNVQEVLLGSRIESAFLKWRADHRWGPWHLPIFHSEILLWFMMPRMGKVLNSSFLIPFCQSLRSIWIPFTGLLVCLPQSPCWPPGLPPCSSDTLEMFLLPGSRPSPRPHCSLPPASSLPPSQCFLSLASPPAWNVSIHCPWACSVPLPARLFPVPLFCSWSLSSL